MRLDFGAQFFDAFLRDAFRLSHAASYERACSRQRGYRSGESAISTCVSRKAGFSTGAVGPSAGAVIFQGFAVRFAVANLLVFFLV